MEKRSCVRGKEIVITLKSARSQTLEKKGQTRAWKDVGENQVPVGAAVGTSVGEDGEQLQEENEVPEKKK